VVAAADADDVVQMVRFARTHGYRVAVQCTGHGAAPFDDDDVLLVHTGRLDGCRIDPEGARARVGAGVTWRPVVAAAARHGLAPIVGGSW
jgi:FAD/FMN-containing dehydrogenase